jgi:hypothetical protein
MPDGKTPHIETEMVGANSRRERGPGQVWGRRIAHRLGDRVTHRKSQLYLG